VEQAGYEDSARVLIYQANGSNAKPMAPTCAEWHRSAGECEMGDRVVGPAALYLFVNVQLCRGILLRRKRLTLVTYSRTMPMALWWS